MADSIGHINKQTHIQRKTVDKVYIILSEVSCDRTKFSSAAPIKNASKPEHPRFLNVMSNVIKPVLRSVSSISCRHIFMPGILRTPNHTQTLGERWPSSCDFRPEVSTEII